MRLTLLAIVCTAIIAIASAAEFRGDAKNPNHPGKCYFEEFNVAIEPHKSFKPTHQCAEYFCNGDLSFVGQTCGVITAEPPCRTVRDLNKVYPECCPRIKC